MAQDLGNDSTRYFALVDSSFVATQSGNYVLAESYLLKAIAIQPKVPSNALLLNNLAGIELMQGKRVDAIKSYTRALDLLPEASVIRFNRARIFALLGQHQAAATDYSLLVSQHPKNELYRYQRAMSYMLLGQYDLADLDLTELINQNGESLKARIGYALLETVRKRYDEAERLFDYLVSKLSKSPDVYEGRARLYLARGMKGYALRDVQKAFELSGAKVSVTLYRLRAEVNRQLGDVATAKRDEATADALERRVDPLRLEPLEAGMSPFD